MAIIRRSVCNLTQKQWRCFDKKAQGEEYVDITVDEWIEEIGVNGGNFLSAKTNSNENEFIESLYSTARLRDEWLKE